MKKVKLTITVDEDVLNLAKNVAFEKHIPLSRVIENFLRFFSKPEFYCFKCGGKFNALEVEVCPKCGWMICPHCNACRCILSEESAIAIFHMRRIYEDLLGGRVK
ncbi:MAG: DUF6364 family protein [Candidatus Methanomethylicia archaeon]